MAKRKPSKNESAEHIIIDAVAEEIDPADVKAKKARPKTPPIQEQKNRGAAHRFSLLLSLIALLFGMSGATLGGLAYLSHNTDHSLTPIIEQINVLDATLQNMAAENNDAVGQAEFAHALEEIAEIRTTLSAIEQANISENGHPHSHDDYADLDEVSRQLSTLSAEIELLKAERYSAQTPNLPKKPTDEGGWWDNLLGVISITRLPSSTESETEQ